MYLVASLLLFSCGKHEESNDIAWSTKHDSVLFKRWLTDTVKLIKRQNINDSIVIYQDSGSMDLYKKYNVVIHPNQPITNIDVETAIWLLKENDTVPEEQFNLQFDINYFFDVGFNGKKHVCECEFENFIVKTSTRTTKYNFVKANLVDKKIISGVTD
ncbi:hypothetical protein Q765_03790 [Flavobacterium rivuli WB 3.3-2 = DSM 21788]|uniref:Uncharacterized protein n=2 Tax=Flavobacterium rivuli TaxID=498301 RepID=A0A0A2M7E5_9FLAO|nr:hypothetical protein Q765_03790 [Flavobacterium rivuli WB 3.3-2 = DSM 21788]